jgi:hypothetical protein
VTGIATAKVVKQRDHVGGEVFGFTLRPIEIAKDEHGAPLTSCVVETTQTPVDAPKRASIPKAAQTALRALAEALDEGSARMTPMAAARAQNR